MHPRTFIPSTVPAIVNMQVAERAQLLVHIIYGEEDRGRRNDGGLVIRATTLEKSLMLTLQSFLCGPSLMTVPSYHTPLHLTVTLHPGEMACPSACRRESHSGTMYIHHAIILKSRLMAPSQPYLCVSMQCDRVTNLIVSCARLTRGEE